MSSDSLLSKLQAAGFFRRYWQRKPLLLPALVDATTLNHIDQQWLYEAAEDSALESRRVTGPNPAGDYEVEYGPGLDADTASKQVPWSLLVRDIDKICDEADALLHAFSDIGRWRMEDVMVSYATEGGSVGAHLDQYDVFLVQTRGRRHWQIDSRPNPNTSQMANQELSLLSHFEPNQQWVLEPGDCLYLPPGVPHHGIALAGEECITCSVGLRTPSTAELWVSFAEYQFGQSSEASRLQDPYRDPELGGQITTQDVDQARQLLGGLHNIDSPTLAHWFGCHVTQSGVHWQDAARVANSKGRFGWQRTPGALLAWYLDDKHCWLFANGAAYPCGQQGAALISRTRRISHEQWSNLQKSVPMDTLEALLNDGIFIACD